MSAGKKKYLHGSSRRSLERLSTSEPSITKHGKSLPISMPSTSSGGTYGNMLRRNSRKGHSLTYPPTRRMRCRSTPRPRIPRTRHGTAGKRRYKIPPRIFHRNIQIRKLGEIDWDEELQERAGVIPYIENNGVVTFCLGVDALYGTLTDFGGGVSQSKESTLAGALRELEEETLQSINRGSIDLSTAVLLSSDKMAIVFARLTSPRDQVEKSFESALPGQKNIEVSSILWIDERTLKNYLRPASKIVYNPVKDLMSKNLHILLPTLC